MENNNFKNFLDDITYIVNTYKQINTFFDLSNKNSVPKLKNLLEVPEQFFELFKRERQENKYLRQEYKELKESLSAMESSVYNTDLKYVNEIVDEILEIDNTDLNDVRNLGLKEKLEMIRTKHENLFHTSSSIIP